MPGLFVAEPLLPGLLLLSRPLLLPLPKQQSPVPGVVRSEHPPGVQACA